MLAWPEDSSMAALPDGRRYRTGWIGWIGWIGWMFESAGSSESAE